MNLVEWMQRTGEVRRLRRQHDELDERYRLKRQAMLNAYRDKWAAENTEHEERNRRHLANQRRISDDCWEFRSDEPQLVGQVANPFGVYRVDPPVWANAGEWHRADFDWDTRTATLTLVERERVVEGED